MVVRRWSFEKAPFDVTATVAPGTAALEDPGAQTYGRVVERVGQGLGVQHVHGHVTRELSFPARQERALGRAAASCPAASPRDQGRSPVKIGMGKAPVRWIPISASWYLCPSCVVTNAPQSPPWAAKRS